MLKISIIFCLQIHFVNFNLAPDCTTEPLFSLPHARFHYRKTNQINTVTATVMEQRKRQRTQRKPELKIKVLGQDRH